MKHAKLFYYLTSAVIFAMYWAMFASFWNWWVGLLSATVITVLQYITQRAFCAVKVAPAEKGPDGED